MGIDCIIGYTPRARLLSDLATECRRHEVAKSLGNQAEVCNQDPCPQVEHDWSEATLCQGYVTTQISKIRLISSIALKSRLIT